MAALRSGARRPQILRMQLWARESRGRGGPAEAARKPAACVATGTVTVTTVKVAGSAAAGRSGSLGGTAGASRRCLQQAAAILAAAGGQQSCSFVTIAGQQSIMAQAGSTATRPGSSSATASAGTRMWTGNFISISRYGWHVRLSNAPLEGTCPPWWVAGSPPARSSFAVLRKFGSWLGLSPIAHLNRASPTTNCRYAQNRHQVRRREMASIRKWSSASPMSPGAHRPASVSSGD